MVYPEPCKELRRRISATISGWDCPLLTFIYPGFDCGSCCCFFEGKGRPKAQRRRDSGVFAVFVSFSFRSTLLECAQKGNSKKTLVSALCFSPPLQVALCPRLVRGGFQGGFLWKTELPSVAFCSPANSLTFRGLMENPCWQKAKVLTSLGKTP